MDEPTFNQQKQQVQTQYNADIIHLHESPTPPSIHGEVEVKEQTSGLAAGVNNPQNQYIGPVTQYYGVGEPSAPPVSLRGRLSRNVPTPSAVFTGREDELRRLHDALQTGDATLTLIPNVPHALHGMGGVGKTQTAAQYAHLHRTDYDGVFWIIGDSPERLQSELAALAPELAPPVEVQKEQEATFRAVLDWFAQHPNWLLIVDNAEDLPHLKPLLPRHPQGRVLLTTREEVPTSFGKRIAIEHLDDTTGATLLLRAAGGLASDAHLDTVDAATQEAAKQVSADLGGLPLALDQAGAYMQPECLSPAAYWERYRERGQKLHRRYPQNDHQRVEVTFSLAFERLLQTPEVGWAAADLAYLCAFLATNTIPDEVFLTVPNMLPEALTGYTRNAIEFREVWEATTHCALLRRETETPGLNMHRLAQEVLRDRLSDEERKAGAQWAMLAVNAAFPESNYPTWPLCGHLLPHALICVQHIQEYALNTEYAARLLVNTGCYLQDRAQYQEAEPLMRQALAIRKQIHGEDHAQVGAALNNLGLLYRDMGRYEEAASCLEQASAITRRVLQDSDPDDATTLNNYAITLNCLAGVYHVQGRHNEATALSEQALDITRRALGEQHPIVATHLNNLAAVYISTDRYEEAETFLKAALTIYRQTLGEDDPEYAKSLVNLAAMYIKCNRAEKAELLLTQAQPILERAHNPQHPAVAECHFWRGRMHYTQSNLAAAATGLRQAWEIWEQTLGPQHSRTVTALNWLEGVQRELAEQRA